jgi:hypothetical protein
MNPSAKKEELLQIVKKNREGHRALFLKAVDGYQVTALGVLKEHIKQIKENKLYQVYFNLPVPEDHTNDYDRVIRMIEMDTREELELTEQEFKMYVMDDWSWKDQWSTSNSVYLSSSV